MRTAEDVFSAQDLLPDETEGPLPNTRGTSAIITLVKEPLLLWPTKWLNICLKKISLSQRTIMENFGPTRQCLANLEQVYNRGLQLERVGTFSTK